MPKLDCPLQLSPIYKEKIWGRADLSPIFNSPEDNPRATRRSAHESVDKPLIGEVWLTADDSRFLNGPVAGMTLDETCRKYGPELVGESCVRASGEKLRFPVLAKYLFTSDWLSVQVHPDDEYAGQSEAGAIGKCEMWYIVQAARTGRYLLGVNPGVTSKALHAACEKGTSRTLLREFHPKPREAVFIPPGTIHALGPGLILFEAEQNCDLTYRLDDFGRLGPDGKPRSLHLKQGFEVARLDLPADRNLPEATLREPFGTRRLVVACSFFAVEDVFLRRSAAFESSPHRVEILSFVEGEGRLETPAGWMAQRPGDTWVIPPGAGKYRLVPAGRTRLLKFYLPDIEKDFRLPLKNGRVGPKKLSRICFD
jgi:mannose-6-phosphate isomerase